MTTEAERDPYWMPVCARHRSTHDEVLPPEVAGDHSGFVCGMVPDCGPAVDFVRVYRHTESRAT